MDLRQPKTHVRLVEQLDREFRTIDQIASDARRTGVWWRCPSGHVVRDLRLVGRVGYCTVDGCDELVMSVGSIVQSVRAPEAEA